MFIIRAVHSKSVLKMNYNFPKLLINMSIILAQVAIILLGIPYWYAYELLLLFIVFAINIKTILTGVRKIVI